MTQSAKRALKENMRTLQKDRPSENKQFVESTETWNQRDSDIDYSNPDIVFESAAPEEDNSRWVQHYTSAYSRYESRVIDLFNTLNTLQSTGNGGATSLYSISETKSSILDMQSEMRRVRNEAQQHNVYISASSWENASY